jgi:hypothetical protein
MVLVDSSVWIDYFRGVSSATADALDGMLGGSAGVATTGIVLQEVLQGTRSDRDYQLYRARLARLPYLPAGRMTHRAAASLYRKLRARGVTVPSIDALIAAVCVDSGARLLTNDRTHFEAIARVSKLKLAA